MNTLRRVTRHMVKAIAAGAVLVAAGLPVAVASTAGAATSPTLYCSQYAATTSVMYNYASTPYCGSMPYGAQNSTITFNLSGANFAFNAGSVSATTTATGVTVLSVTENNANSASVMLAIGATTAPGYYPLTLTDANGSATLANAFGVDPSGTVTNVSPSSVPEGSATLVTVTGTGLTSGSVGVSPAIPGFTVSNGVANAAGTSLTFYVYTTATLALGSYPVNINSVTSSNSIGNPGVNITVTGASISSLSPSQLGHNTTASTVTQNITISGSGFVAGAVVRIEGNTLPYSPFLHTNTALDGPEVTFGAATVVNSTTITVPVTTAVATLGPPNYSVNAAPLQWNVSVTNPNGTTYNAVGALGWLEAGSAAYTTPAVTMVTNGLTPGNSTVTLAGNPAFPLSGGDVVTLTNGRFSFTGAMLDGTHAGFYLPQYLSTTLTSAVVAGATNLPVASLSGIATGTALTFVDATGDSTTAAGTTAVTNTVQVPALADGHAAGTSVEFPIQGVTGWTLSVNNGSTTLPIAGLNIGATPASSLSYMRTNGTSNTLSSPTPVAPGTYTFLYTYPGANLASTGAAVSFVTAGGINPDNVTGKIAVTSPDTAWVTFTLPSTNSTPQYTNTTDTVGAAVPVGVTSVPVSAVANLSAGGTYILGYGLVNAETVTISPTWNGASPITLTAPTRFAHAGGEPIYSVTYPASTGTTYYPVISNGNGQLLKDPTGFATTAASNVTVTGMAYTGAVPLASPGLVIGSGASNVSVNITGAFNGSNSPLDYVVTSTTPGVSFGAVSAVTNGNANTGFITVTMSVAAGTPVNTSVQFTVTELNGAGTSSLPTAANPNSGVLIGNTPTITAVTGLPTSMKPGETATFSITGTLFDASTVTALNGGSAGFLADSGNLKGMLDTGTRLGLDHNGVVVSGCVLNSSTSITCSVTVNGGATNGAHDLMITNDSYGSATFANALTVSTATIGAISPTFYQSNNSANVFTLSGLTGFNVAQGGPTPNATVTTYFPGGGADYTSGLLGTTWVNATTVTVLVPSLTPAQRPAGGYMTITLRQNPSASGYDVDVDAPAISLGLPLVISNQPSGFSSPAGTSGAFQLAAGSSTYGSPFNGLTTFMPGAVVSVVPATNGLGISTTAGISVSGVTVLPGLISGTITVSGSTPAGTYTLQVLNPDGGVAYTDFTVSAAPSVTAVNGVPVISGPVSFLSGTKTTLTIAGSNLQDGAVVSASVPGDATFGTATANNSATVLTVPVTFTSFTGATPVVLDLTVTNADGGVTTVTGEIVLNPQPSVTGGPYYVPTFTTNTQLVVTGTGFEAGMTVASSNADYTVSVANVTPTAATLLVSTNSNATSGTNTTLTFTNPDGGTTTMTLNGGPVPNAPIKAIKVVTAVWTGKTTATKIIGSGFYGQPKITSNVGGTKVGVSGDNGTVLTISVTVAKTAPRGVHTFTLLFKNGEVVRVKYNQR